MSKSYQGSKSDMELMELPENGFWRHLNNNEFIMVDKGFRGLDRLYPNICIPFFHDEIGDRKEFNHELSHYRIIVENVFAQIKKWKICSFPLNLKFKNMRDALEKHDKIWRTIAFFTNKFHSFGNRK